MKFKSSARIVYTLIIYFIFYTVDSITLRLKSSGQSRSKCNTSFIDHVDRVNYTAEINSTAFTIAVFRVNIQRQDENQFEHFCALGVPADCDSLPYHKCACVTVISQKLYRLNTNIIATTSLSNALIRAELQYGTVGVISNTVMLPPIHEYSINNVELLFNDTYMNKSDCRITITEPFIVLLYRCINSSPSPCRLNISDASTNETLKTGDGQILFYNKDFTQTTLMFTYSSCELPKVYSFSCKIQTDFSGGNSVFWKGDKNGTSSDCTIIITALTVVSLTVSMCTVIIWYRARLKVFCYRYGHIELRQKERYIDSTITME